MTVAGAVAGVARVPGRQRAAQRQGQAQVDGHGQRDAFQRQPGLGDGGVDHGHQLLVADGDGQGAVLDQRQALVGVGGQSHARGIGRDNVAQHAPGRQRHGLAGFHQADRHRPHGGAHDVGDVGRMEHHQADHQGGEFDAGLPAALQAQAALDGQIDGDARQQRPGQRRRRQRGPGRGAAEAMTQAPAEQHGARRRQRVRQPAMQRRQCQPAVRQQHGRQRRPRLARVRQAQQEAIPDEQLQQYRGVAQWRDDERGSARCQRLRRQPQQAQADAQQGGERNRHQRDRQRVRQPGGDRHPVGIVGRHRQQAFRNAEARRLEQEAEAAADAARRLRGLDVQQQYRRQGGKPQGPGGGWPPAPQRGVPGRGVKGNHVCPGLRRKARRLLKSAQASRRPAWRQRVREGLLERRRIQQAALVPLPVQAAIELERRGRAQVAVPHFAIVADGLDHVAGPAFVQPEALADAGVQTQ
ncbi:hypothetical protein LMG7053_05871 [Achromobacter ruhlandii]|uniref:Uncharacterized protein n=1 Tax=Achromobacter ruhlandii TaxID=72557 RepID=A0ABM8M5R6_9BURK|nr:hypothetical protein LMG7053_05871 [Achromobacter ruhlandii]